MEDGSIIKIGQNRFKKELEHRGHWGFDLSKRNRFDYSWDFLITEAKKALLREKEIHVDIDWVLAGWEFLSVFYGDEHLKWLMQSDGFGTGLFNALSWARVLVGNTGNILMTLSTRSDFKIIRNRLLNLNELPSARVEAEVAYLLDQKGIQNSFVERSSEPSPDLLATIADRQIAIEIHKQSGPKHPLFHDRFTSDIYRNINLEGIVHTGVIHRPISMNKWRDLIERSKIAVSVARDEERIVEVIEDWIAGPIAELAFAPSFLEKEILIWKNARTRWQSRFADIDPPVFETDIAKRVNRSIRGKVRQIPLGLPGVIFIEGANLQFRINPDTSKPVDNEDYSWGHLSRIEEFVCDNPKIAYVVLKDTQLAHELPECKYDFNPIWIGRKKKFQKIYDDVVVIRNRFSNHEAIPRMASIFL